jgi:translation initiation factor 3 subunit D
MQINLSMENGWGVLRMLIDVCMKLPDGKYLLMKDPNKPMVRLYDVPDDTFASDNEEDGEGAEGDEDGEGDDEQENENDAGDVARTKSKEAAGL